MRAQTNAPRVVEVAGADPGVDGVVPIREDGDHPPSPAAGTCSPRWSRASRRWCRNGRPGSQTRPCCTAGSPGGGIVPNPGRASSSAGPGYGVVLFLEVVEGGDAPDRMRRGGVILGGGPWDRRRWSSPSTGGGGGGTSSGGSAAQGSAQSARIAPAVAGWRRRWAVILDVSAKARSRVKGTGRSGQSQRNTRRVLRGPGPAALPEPPRTRTAAVVLGSWALSFLESVLDAIRRRLLYAQGRGCPLRLRRVRRERDP